MPPMPVISMAPVLFQTAALPTLTVPVTDVAPVEATALFKVKAEVGLDSTRPPLLMAVNAPPFRFTVALPSTVPP